MLKAKEKKGYKIIKKSKKNRKRSTKIYKNIKKWIKRKEKKVEKTVPASAVTQLPKVLTISITAENREKKAKIGVKSKKSQNQTPYKNTDRENQP